jgi:hypothetical protein
MNLLANFQIGMSVIFLLWGGLVGLRYILEHIPWDDRLDSGSWSMATKLSLSMISLCLELAAVVDGILNCNTGTLRYVVALEDI